MSLLMRRIGDSWLRGIMLKVTGRLMAGALTLWPSTVCAAAADAKKSTPAKINWEELSLYASPQQDKTASEEPKTGHMEQGAATLRMFAEPYTAWCRTTYERVEPKVQNVVRQGCDAWAFLKDPPGEFYARAGIIGLTGVLGLLLARRSRVKRVIYPAALMTTSASLYYPDRAAVIARSAGDTLYEGAVHGYATLESIIKPASKADQGDNSKGKH
ncbi:MICOS complex subunit MIC26-like [Corythoichthys intestinalis]|uniref:MICOS complex subunit MIC26-like n=1 Tax=Corythoichthys intestinalis TaxID=161448 RepID=UPI0025A4E09C|nr:MICOS complex subunit MIC26-like [Corythoichthys intestinalis]